jgi:transcriptional antiterminator NusG
LDKTAGLGESGQDETVIEEQATGEAAAAEPDSAETPGGDFAADSSDGGKTVADEETAELPSPFAAPAPDAAAVSEAASEVAETAPVEAAAEVAESAAESPETGDVLAVEATGTESPEVAEAEPVAEAETEPEAEPVVETAAVEEAEAVAEPVVESDGAGDAAASEEAEAPPQAGVPGIDWYIIHTYSGFENKVKESLRTRAEAFGFNDRIGEILIPTEDVVEMRSGNKITSKRMLYPGYVLLQLKMDDELWHVVKNTPRVTGFVGSGPTPTPLTADEVNQILFRQTSSVEKPRAKMTFEKSDRVKIIDGPFTNFTGTVEEANPDRNTLKVMVTIFGRDTPVELEHFQVENERI